MSLIKVPVFSPLNEKNGTLISFQNFNNDLTQSFANGATFKRVPSKFVVVKIPRWNNTVGRHLYMSPDKISTTPLVTDPNILFPKLLQNYMENLNAYAIKEGIKDSNIPEISFWKLMNTLGAINLDVKPDGTILDTIQDNDEFIKYIGDINVVNYVEYENRTYTEQYIHIQHDAKKLSKLNWKNGATSQKTSALVRLPQLENGQDISLGLKDDPNELTNAVYDLEANGDSKQYYDFSLKSNKAVIDFTSAVAGTDIEDFEFNAILLYYDTYELDAKGNAIGRKTKLGNIFLTDNFKHNPAGGYWEIPSTTKYNSNENNVLAGNAIAYRLLTNFFTSNEQSTIDKIVNQFNNVSMDLYAKALSEMMKTADLYNNENSLVVEIANRLNKLTYGEDLYERLRESEEKLKELTNTVNSVIGSSGYTVTNFELLDVFQKLSNDFKGLNGQNVENVFIFNGNIDNNEIKFNKPYTYVVNGKYSIGYADEAMLQIGLIRNRLLSKYSVVHKKVGNYLNMKLTSANDPITYAVDGQIYTNAVNNQEIQIAFSSSDVQAIPYVLVINKSNGKFEIYDYDFMKKTALENFAYVGYFILPSSDSYDENGIPTLEDPESLAKLDNEIHVQLREGENQGTYDTGDIIPAGTTLREVVKKMLVDTKNLTYTPPHVEVMFKPSMLANDWVYTPLTYKTFKNDAGKVRASHVTSNSFDVAFTVNFQLGTISFAGKKYSVTDPSKMGILLNEMLTIRENTTDNRYELFSYSHKFLTTDKGTILKEVDEDGDPTEEYEKVITMPLSTTGDQVFNLNIAVDYKYGGLEDTRTFLVPLKYTSTMTNFIVDVKLEYEAGVKKYDIFGNVVAGFIEDGESTHQFQFGNKPPVFIASFPSIGDDVTNISMHPHTILSEYKKIFTMDVKATGTTAYIAFCVPDTIGNDNSYTLLSCFIDDGLRFNVLSCKRSSDAIKIDGVDYSVDYYEIPAGFIVDTTIKATISQYDDYSTYDLSYDPTYK